MSDLSFLIQNQNQVVIDQLYLQKYLQSNQRQQQINKISSRCSENPHSKNQIKCNQTKTHPRFKDKDSNKNQRKNNFGTQNQEFKFSSQSSDTITFEKEEMTKIAMRIKILQENQTKLQQKIGVDLFQIKQNLVKWSRQQNYQVEHVNRIKCDVNETQKKIGHLLTLISEQPN